MLSTSLTYGDDPDQVYERFGQPSQVKPTLVLVHGGYWRSMHDREHMRPLAEALAKIGWPVVLAEYRRSPNLPENTLQDINSLLSSLSPEPLILIGFSVGGQLALLTANQHQQVRKVIALAPVTDLVATEREGLGENAVIEWLHEPAEMYPELDPMKVASPNVPVTVFHGTVDVRVPLQHSLRYLNTAVTNGANIRLIEVEGAGHFDLLDPTHPFFRQMVNELEQ